MQFEDFALKTDVIAFASRSKAKAKPQRRDSASSSTRTILLGERTRTFFEPQTFSLSDYPAHPQRLYPLGKELGRILSQKIIRPSLTQCQNN